MINVEYTFQGKKTTLDPLIEKVIWSGDIMQAARKLEVALNNTLNGKTKAVLIEEGGEIVFRYEKEELFRGVLFSDSINDKGQHTFVAYDENTYLTRNEDTVKIAKETASAFIKRMCGKFGIATGTITNTGYVIPKMILRDMSLWDMFVTVLTETRKRTGKKFVISCEKGKLCLRERKDNAVKWVLENGVNILSAEYSRSIEETRTQVKVIGETKKKSEVVAVVKDDKLIKLYGTMQHLESVSGEATKAQVEALAKELLKQLATIDDSASITALGKKEVIAGKAVYVKESMTGIVGGYYVSTDSHEFVGNYHTMNVKLSATAELPTMEYKEDTKDAKKESKPAKKTADKKKETTKK